MPSWATLAGSLAFIEFLLELLSVESRTAIQRRKLMTEELRKEQKERAAGQKSATAFSPN